MPCGRFSETPWVSVSIKPRKRTRGSGWPILSRYHFQHLVSRSVTVDPLNSHGVRGAGRHKAENSPLVYSQPSVSAVPPYPWTQPTWDHVVPEYLLLKIVYV